MTQIKYATTGHSRGSNNITVVRGKKTERIGFREPDDGSDRDVFGDPIYSEEVVALPEPMSPGEFDAYLKTLSYDDDIPQAALRVAEEHGIDTDDWEWPEGERS